MTSITWASLRYVQEAATILGSQNRTQGSCELKSTMTHPSQTVQRTAGHSAGWRYAAIPTIIYLLSVGESLLV